MTGAALAPTEQATVGAVAQEATSVLNQARAMRVQIPAEAQAATEFLAHVATAKSRGEKARKFLVKPLNDHVKAINDEFKRTAAPLEEADQLVRDKLLAFTRDEEQRVAAEQARLDSERRAEEQRAEAERRRQAEEAARVERGAQQHERDRQAQLREAANERAREIAMLSDGELCELLAIAAGDDERLAKQEFDSRLAAREAQERADTARREAEEAQQREIATKSAPTSVAAPTRLASQSGSASVRKVWRAFIEDETRLPREYLQVDVKKITSAVRDGVRGIPGVRIAQVDELSVRTGR